MRERSLLALTAVPLMGLAACAHTPQPPTTPAAPVQARGQTEPVGTLRADAADDPAIWRNAADPAASLIVATDKKAGLYVYGLDGARRDYVKAGLVNNVDLRETPGGVILAASDRTDATRAKIAMFRLDTQSAKLRPLGTIDAAPGEAYGLCLGSIAGQLHAFVVLKDGTIAQLALDLSQQQPTGKLVRTMKLATQSEGCVVDDRTGQLFVAEENVGIWRFGAAANAPTTPEPIARVDGTTLVADVEGLAIAAAGEAGGYLVASSQGDNAFSLYTLPSGTYAGRVRVQSGTVGAVSETDGIEVKTGDFGPQYPGGLFVVQDGDNAPAGQNFKLLAWADVLAALEQAP